MTVTEILPDLKLLNRKDKIRVIQFLVNEVAEEEETTIFSENQEHEFISQTDAFEASRILLQMIEERKTNATT